MILVGLHQEGVRLHGCLRYYDDDDELEFSWATQPHDVWVTCIEAELLVYVNIRERVGRAWKSHIREMHGRQEEKITGAVALLKSAFTRPPPRVSQ
jgi:hypothetical protein